MMALSFDSSDGGILSVDSHRVVPAPFLTKTYQLVDDHLTNDIVSWGEDGSTFVVWRPPEFARDLLPNYFKHNNFSSFVRQLNTYGFRKVVPDRWEFANDFFRKGERHLLCEIHRRKAQALVSPGNILHYGSSLSPTTSGEEHAAAVASGWSSSPLPSPRASTAAAAAVSVSLSDENERLRRDNCLLLSELARLQKLYDDAVMFLQQHMRLSSVDDLRLVRNHHQTSNGLQQLQRQFLLEPPRARAPAPNENAEFCNSRNQRPCFGGAKFPSEGAAAAAPRASTIDFVDGKLRELAGNNVVNKGTASSPAATCVDQDDGKSSSPGPKLFGVVLHGRKRLHPEQQHQFHIEDSFPPAAKSAKTELDLMPHAAAAAATEAPWLRFRASRDERVCM